MTAKAKLTGKLTFVFVILPHCEMVSIRQHILEQIFQVVLLKKWRELIMFYAPLTLSNHVSRKTVQRNLLHDVKFHIYM